MRKLIVLFILGATSIFGVDTLKDVPEIKLSDTDKITLLRADNETLYARLRLMELEKEFLAARESFIDKQRNLQKTLDETMLKYIEKDQLKSYKLNGNLDLEKVNEQ